jgi:hypothetical protein
MFHQVQVGRFLGFGDIVFRPLVAPDPLGQVRQLGKVEVLRNAV